jgi:hypothetical protein
MLSPTQHLLHDDGRPGSEPDVVPGSPADLALSATPLLRALARGLARLRAALIGFAGRCAARPTTPPRQTHFSSR